MRAHPRILGVTPARGGSKGIPRKNLRPVAGRPLLAWTIDAAQSSQRLDDYVISTEDPEISTFARQMGVRVIDRPTNLATDESGTIPVLEHVLSVTPADIVVLLQATSPVRSQGLIDDCVDRFIEANADSLATGHMVDLFEYGTYGQRRQDLDGWFHDDGNVYVFRADILRRGDRYGDRRETLVISREENVEIDDEFDLWLAEQVLRRRTPRDPPGPLVVIGAGDHARVVLDAARALSVPITGCLTVRPDLPALRELDGAPVLGSADAIPDLLPSGTAVIAAVGDNASRRDIEDAAIAAGMRPVSVIHPAASISTNAHLADGCFVAAGAVIGPGARLDRGVIVNTAASVDHDCRIGPFSQIAPGAHLNGRVSVGGEVLIAVGASVVQGVEIGDHTIVGAGSVVTRSLPPNVRAWGSPAKAHP